MLARARFLVSMAADAVQRHGLVGTLRKGAVVRDILLQTVWEYREGFDRRHGTDTARMVSTSDLQASGGNVAQAIWYWPTSAQTLPRMLRRLAIDFAEFVFIDYGSGKGRALVLASEFPFKRIVGVEFSPTLVETARENLRIYRSPTQACRSFELHCMDAVEYPPPAEPCVFYLFHPFGAPVLARVLQVIEASLRARPRAAYLLYLCPEHHELMEASGFLEPIAAAEAVRSLGAVREFGWRIYRNRGYPPRR